MNTDQQTEWTALHSRHFLFRLRIIRQLTIPHHEIHPAIFRC